MPTVMAEVITDAEVEEIAETAEVQENQLLAAMVGNPEGSMADWAIECEWFQPNNKTVPYKSLVQRVLKRLEKSRLIKKYGRGFTLTPAGKKAAKSAEADAEAVEGST